MKISQQSTRKKAILLIEDDSKFAMATLEVLNANGFGTVHALRGESAIEEISNNPDYYGLILLDIDPSTGIDGTIVAQEILKIKFIPILFLSSHFEKEVIEKTEKISSYGFIIKNSGDPLLIASINNALKLHNVLTELEDKSNLLENILDCSTDFVFVKDRELRTVLCNEPVAKMVGKTRQELYGHNDIENGVPEEIVKGNPEKGIRGYEQDDLDTVNGKTIYNHADPVYADGKLYIYDTIKRPLKNVKGEIIGLLGISRDITDRRRAEELLIKSEEQYRMLFNEMTNGFALHEIILDENGKPIDIRFLSVNPAYEKNIGLKKENIIGKTIFEILPDFEKHWIDTFGRVALTGESIKFESTGKGLNKFFSVSAFSYKKGTFATIIEDITERKNIEMELKEAVKSRDVLLKEFQHRVKNNLLSISMLLGLEMENLSKENEARKIIIKAQSRIRSISAIYDQLTYSENKEKINLCLYIKNLVNTIFETYTTGNVTIQLPEYPEIIELDIKLVIPLGLVLNELITNSIKYAYPSNVQGEVRIDVNKIDNTVTIIVTDYGIGLPENFKLEDAESMGLKLVSLLTAQIRGKLNIDTNIGAKFILSFGV
jgi:PAS domain S-box-containing protein